jgi:hypothetical protein
MLAFQITCEADGSIDLAVSSTAEYLKDVPNNSPGSSESDWSAIALCIAKKDFDKQSYEKKLSEYVKQKYSESSLLSANKATEWHRIALSVAAMGENAENFNGTDLVSDGVFDVQRLEKQGINAYIWALITVNAVGASDKDVSFLIDKIISSQNEDGGYSLSGKNSDVDVTSMAICALAPYRERNDVFAAVKSAVENLSAVQNEDGGFSSWGTENDESTAQVVVALSSLGIDSDKDERFVKSGGSALEALMRYWTGEGFSHTYGGENNVIASYQSLIALCAYQKKSYIYSFTSEKKKAEIEVKTTEKAVEAKEEKTESAEKEEEETEEETLATEETIEEESESETDLNENCTEKNDYTLSIAICVISVVIIAATAFFIRRKYYVKK